MNKSTNKRPRGTYSLGGCETCRRRHVKCDKVRPRCLTCQAVGVQCDGFQYSGIKWVADQHEDGPDSGTRRSRRPLYTVKLQSSMSHELRTTLPHDTVDELLLSIDTSYKEGRNSQAETVTIGPFGVLSFENDTQHGSDPQEEPLAAEAADSENVLTTPPCSTHVDKPEDPALAETQPSAFNFWINAGSVLDWPDLFDLDSTPTWFPLDLAKSAEQYSSEQSLTSYLNNEANSIGEGQSQIDAASFSNSELQHDPSEPIFTSLLSLEHAQLLLRHFSECMVAHIWSLPLGEKSSMDIHVDAVVTTLGRLTFMRNRRVSHAALSHFYSVLSLASMHLSTREGTENVEYWRDLAEKLAKESRHNYHYSLHHEVSPKTAKYKDLVMAVSSILCFTILYDRQVDTRTYMIESERLLRTIGLAKATISRKTSYLHHTYTWARIVGESTYVLQDYGKSESRTTSTKQNHGSQNDPPATIPHHIPVRNTQSDPHPRLDDFLGLEPSQPDDPSVMESPAGNIHLESSDGKSDSALRFLYGISEGWLSLVSQTTRLANFLERLATRYEKLDNAFLDFLESRKKRLENLIWAFAGSNPLPINDTNQGGGGSDQQSTSSGPRAHLLKALNHALIIFFYRRIRDVHPCIMQQHVDVVIQALRDFDVVCDREGVEGPGTPWPAFIAGCEAMNHYQREFLLNWLQKSFQKTGFSRFNTIISCMQEVWRRQGEALRTGNQDWTWVHVSRDQNIYVILC